MWAQTSQASLPPAVHTPEGGPRAPQSSKSRSPHVVEVLDTPRLAGLVLDHGINARCVARALCKTGGVQTRQGVGPEIMGARHPR